jgi:hypothetical protein
LVLSLHIREKRNKLLLKYGRKKVLYTLKKEHHI